MILLLILLLWHSTAMAESAATDCSEFVTALSSCRAQMCLLGTGQDIDPAKMAFKQIIGLFPGGCRYVEFFQDKTVTCTFPVVKLSSIGSKHFKGQEHVSVLDMISFEGQLKNYCVVDMADGVGGKDVRTLSQIINGIEDDFVSGRIHPVLLTSQEMRVIVEALNRRDSNRLKRQGG